MRPLSAAELLTVWEENWQRPPLWQGLALLAAACADVSEAALLATPVGRYNVQLLTLHRWHFGSSLTAVAACPACNGVVEVTLDVTSLCQQHGDPPPALLAINHADDVIHFRLPTLDDLIAAGAAATVEEASRLMVQRCLETPPDDLSPAALAAATAAMETADPLALIELGGACPHCGHAWTAFLDVAAFVWREVQHWAQRTLQEVHLLARAYGWREDEILRLSPVRRQTYLQMAYG